MLQRLLTVLCGLYFCLLASTSVVAQTDGDHSDKPFPFVITDVKEGSVVDFSNLNPKPAGVDGFCRVVDGHFANDGGRLRIWGVNFCFGANFPEHAEAERIASRLASYGINGVRIHHQETSLSPSGLYRKDGKMDPAQVDKLDYLLAQLHEHGIYANINLHVGRSVRQSLGFPELGRGHSATGDKHAMHFMPQLQEAFWQYCRDYLGHTNPYRKLSRAKDPGVAMVEMLNENRFSRDGARYLSSAPEPYRSEILKQWNAWLVRNYGDEASLRQSWKSEDAGKTIADSHRIGNRGPSDGGARALGGNWNATDNGGEFPIKLVVDASQGLIRLEPVKPSSDGWQQQVACEKLSFEKGKRYTLSFEARAEKDRKCSLNTSTLEGGWRQLGLGGSVDVTGNWKSSTMVFSATDSVDGTGRLAFDLGGDPNPIELRNIKLRTGAGLVVVPAGQSLDKQNIGIPDSLSTMQAQEAFVEFMRDTERSFYRKTATLLRKELGLQVPICSTQTNYLGADLAAEAGDYTDMHSYWNHPLFLGRQWDQSNWSIGHEPIEANPYKNDWPLNSPMMRAAWRVHGMPFTYSEWNIGEPSLPSAGAIPIMSLLGALQDWDAVFFFDYEDKGGVWDADRLDGYFRLNSQPCKLALLGPFGQLYRNGGVAVLTEKLVSAEGAQQRDGVHAFEKLIGLDPTLPRVEGNSPPDPEELSKTHPPLLTTTDGTAIWDAREEEKATIRVDSPKVRAVWGLIGGQSAKLGDWELQFGKLPGDYGVFIATPRDARSWLHSRSVLLTVVNHAENTQMHWNESGNSVGNRWGEGPTITWGVPVRVTIPSAGHSVQVFALDQQGVRKAEVPTHSVDGKTVIELGPSYQTLNYELELKR